MSTSLKTSAAAFLIAIGFGGAALFAQSAKFDEVSVSKARMDTAKPVSAGQSVLNTSLALDELEERKINDVYEQIVKIHLQGDYPAAANMYETLVIPMAERTRSDLAKNKFLFLGYRGL